jgi:hypothetical protein
MRFKKLLFLCALATIAGGAAWAELQNVELSGNLRIRGNYYGYDSLPDVSYIQERTRLGVKADFTNDITAFVEFDSYSVWGEGFRSNYLTGIDTRGDADVSLYQGYIEVRNMWGVAPLTLKVGRQELKFGDQFLVGVNDASSDYRGLSFDAVRLTYKTDVFSVDAVASKLAETFNNFGKGDTDFYVLYGSYTGIENTTLDAYWMYLRDDGALLPAGNTVDINTIGLRGAGTLGSFDYKAEVAYQFGSIDDLPSACPSGFGTADTDYGTFGINSEIGYTFDAAWSPRPFARFAYFGGGDPDRSLCSNDRTLPFNRLFSNIEYSEFIETTDLSNVFYYAAGVDLVPMECIKLQLVAAYFAADQAGPVTDDSSLGWEAGLYGSYQYSEDLVFRAGYIHFFGDDGLEDAYIAANGLRQWGGDGDDQYDYLYIETEISF